MLKVNRNNFVSIRESDNLNTIMKKVVVNNVTYEKYLDRYEVLQEWAKAILEEQAK